MSQISKTIKRQVAERAGFLCEYCRSQWFYSPTPFTIEHIHPTSKGGTKGPENLAFSCGACNGCKYTHTHAIDPFTNSLSRLFNPRIDRWDDHFNWSEDYLKIAGTTPIGRATVGRLKLNDFKHLNLRQILINDGKHPPRT